MDISHLGQRVIIPATPVRAIHQSLYHDVSQGWMTAQGPTYNLCSMRLIEDHVCQDKIYARSQDSCQDT